MEKNYDQNKRHVLISGGSKGLGLELARTLLQEGYSVSTFSRTKTFEIEALLTLHPTAFYYASLDIQDSSALSAFVEKAHTLFNNFYALINNAAIVQEGILATLPEVEIEKMVAVNITSSFALTRLFLRKMLTAKSGRIINISSIIGSRGYSGLSVYSATKAALDGMTRSLSREIGSRHITVNSVAPGYMKSDLSASLSPEQLEQIKRRTPLGRLATAHDVTPLIRFLLSDDASFITGQTILIDGGISN